MDKDAIRERRRSRAPRSREGDPYDPRHYSAQDNTGLKPQGPKRQGWLFIAGVLGSVLAFAIMGPAEPVLYWFYSILLIGVGALAIAVSVKSIKGSNGRTVENRDC